jgi:DNA modification methylase
MSLPLERIRMPDRKQFDLPRRMSSSQIARSSSLDHVSVGATRIPRYTREFWSSAQRQSSSLHEVSYRACFKAQLPQFFVQNYSDFGETIYDPFMGRGTTLIEAALANRRVIGNDINPLSSVLCEPRLHPPTEVEVKKRLENIRFNNERRAEIDLSMFYHRRTEAELISLRNYLSRRRNSGKEDYIDRWIRMIATSRLTGHSPGFFSVYSLPPNQAVSQEDQKRINKARKQKPEYRDVKALILRKTHSMLRDLAPKQIQSLRRIGKSARFLSKDARHTPLIRSNSVKLVVTSPPFLNIVDYASDNWLRCWFNMIDVDQLAQNMIMSTTLKSWCDSMKDVLKELRRVCTKGGVIAFEVGEMANGRIKLDEFVAPLGIAVGLECTAILVNEQPFTKTSNIWGVKNNTGGTNTNRIVMFRKPI